MSLLRRIRSATDPRYRRQRRLLREYVEAVLLEQGIALEHGEAGALIPLSAQCLADLAATHGWQISPPEANDLVGWVVSQLAGEPVAVTWRDMTER